MNPSPTSVMGFIVEIISGGEKKKLFSKIKKTIVNAVFTRGKKEKTTVVTIQMCQFQMTHKGVDNPLKKKNQSILADFESGGHFVMKEILV